MKIAVVDAYEFLSQSKLMKDVDIYTNSVPESEFSNPKLPLARIVELYGEYDDFSSDSANTVTHSIQLDLWVDTLDEVEKYYFDLDVTMAIHNWQCTYTEQTDDPDLENSKRIIKRYKKTQFTK